MNLRSVLSYSTQLFNPVPVSAVSPKVETPAIALRNVCSGFRKRQGVFSSSRRTVLHNVSLTIEHGETLGILGLNGVGKTTLLRLLAGAMRPDSGSVNTYGNRVALLSLQGGMLPYLSGRDNSVLMGVALGMRRKHVQQELGEILNFSGLGDAFYEPIRTYSSGMKARLGFAVALRVQADVLLVDELLSVGDSSFREKSSRAMREHVSSGKAAVVVSHNQQVLAQLCTNVAILYEGRLSAPMPVQEALRVWKGLSEKR